VVPSFLKLGGGDGLVQKGQSFLGKGLDFWCDCGGKAHRSAFIVKVNDG